MSRRVAGTVFMALFASSQLARTQTLLTFETLNDGDTVSSQFPGLVFSKAQTLVAGFSLDELEYPVHSGKNVIVDQAGPVTIVFSSAISAFSGFFTHSKPITVAAFDSAGNPLATTTSSKNNAAISGDGTPPNELLSLSGTNIAKIVITGDPAGNSLVADDLSYTVPSASGTITLSVGNGIGAPGLTTELAIQAVVTGADPPVGLQADLNFDTTKLRFVSARLGPQLTAAEKNLSTTTLPNGDVRLLTSGFNQNAIGSGVLAYATFTLNSQFLSGTSLVTAKNCSATDAQAAALGASCTTGGTVKALNCDVNLDSATNVADVQLVINEALGVATAVHDFNGDDAVNVADVQKVINAALGLGCIVP